MFQSLADLKRQLAALPSANAEAAAAAKARDAQLTKPPGALGRLESLAFWLAAWQGRRSPSVERVQVCVFAGNHGVAARGVSAFPAEVTQQMVANFAAGGAAINQLCDLVGAELEVHALELERPTADISAAPAMSEAEFLAGLSAGYDTVRAETDLLCIGEMGIANTTVAAALASALYGGTARDWVGPGTGVDATGLALKADTVERALATHGAHLADPLQVARRLGGRELAAMAGAVLAARMQAIPVLIDGYVASAAVAPFACAAPGFLDHCQAAHRSAEPAHTRLLEALGLEPILDLGMRLGEASGAALCVAVIRAAAATHNGMATFADAGVSES